MTANVTINPYVTSNAQNTFNIDTVGYIQGTALDQPAIRNSLAGGVLAPTETLVMWGGVAISETTTPLSGSPVTAGVLGGNITRALNLSLVGAAGALSVWSVFDQDYAMINSPQSPVPLIGVGGQVNFYRLGSGARIAVACAASLSSLEGNVTSQQVSWDYVSQMLVPYSPAYVANPITGAVWASTSGGRTTFTVTNDLSAVLAAGDIIDVSGVVSTGGTGAGFNGEWTVVSVTSTTIVVTQAAASSPGTYSSGGSVAAGGGALPVKVLDVSIGNSMTVSYSATTGFAQWNYSGNAAIILI